MNLDLPLSDLDSSQVRVFVAKGSDIELRTAQKIAVKKLVNDKKEDPDGQMLVWMQGFPGSGKTTTAKALETELGFTILFAGSTSTASAQLKTDTINRLAKLGLSVSNCDFKDLGYAKKQIICDNFRGIDLLVIDEASMLTPVTLARIDFHLRQAMGNDKPFGGFDVILIGDFYQFPPVAKELSKPALYQAAVCISRGLRMPNEPYRTGAALFTKFRLVVLEGQVRANPSYDKWLSNLRNPDLEFPITDDWLSKLQILTPEDIKADEKWRFSPVIVSGNRERRKIIEQKALMFGKVHDQPVLQWDCKVKKGKVGNANIYGSPDPVVVEVYGELRKFFVRGAEFVMSETIETKLGLAKGTKGILLGAVWADETIDIDMFPKGEVSDVPQPEFVVVKIGDYVLSLKSITARFNKKGDPKKKISFKDHGFDMTMSVTFHKTQGITVDRIVLSLNSAGSVSRRINKLTITSLYVGASRVHDFNELRVLPFTAEDAAALKKLKRDPLLAVFFSNFDENGHWKNDGLLKQQKQMLQRTKIELGLADLTSLTGEEMYGFINNDLHVEKQGKSPNVAEQREALRDSHEEGRKLLLSNEGFLLKCKRVELMKKMIKEGLSTMKTKRMRFFAKRLGVKNCGRSGQRQLRTVLQKMVSEAGSPSD